MAKLLGPSEVPLIASQTLARIGQHSIGFVQVVGDEDDARIAGSGTLISAAGIPAILTADHVLRAIPNQGSAWLVICREGWSRRHRVMLDAAAIRKITVGKASHTKDGPDLGVAILTQHEAAKLSALQTFYNLDKRRERMRLDPITKENWALFGMVHERTVDVGPEGKFTRVKGFYGHVGFGAMPIERRDATFDYLDFVALYNEQYEGPESYEGTSGGGLWQLEYVERDGSIEVGEALLSGVAYFESPRMGETRTIFCHGRRSIYENVYTAIKTSG